MNRRTRRGFVSVSLFALLLLLLAAPASAVTLESGPSAGDQYGTGFASDVAAIDAETNSDADPVEVRYDVDFLPAREGVVELTISLSVPDRGAASSATFAGQGGIEVLETRGFDERIGDGTYEFVWDERRSDASVTYRLDTEAPSRICADQTATADWAFVCLRPTIETAPDVPVESTYEPGGAGDGLYTLLGEHDEYVRETHGQRIRMVVPKRASMHERPADVLEALAYGSRTVRVGNRNPEVFVITVPDPVRGGGAALSSNEEFWVHSDSTLRWNAWGHEYVHTRQDRDLAASARWLTEAEASYYQHLLSYERKTINDGYRWYPRSQFAWLQHYLSVDESEQAGVVLAKPKTWTVNSNYRKGGLVIAALDAELRASSGGAVTYQDVMRELNDRESVDHETFVDALETVVTDANLEEDVDVDDFVERYVTGDELPAVPQDPSLYHQGEPAFDVDFDLAVDLESGVETPTGATDAGETPARAIVTDETVTLTATLESTGSDPSVTPEIALETPDGWKLESVAVARDGTTSEWAVDDGAASTAEFAPGDAVTVTATVVAPAGASGTYDLHVVASDADEHRERATVPLTVVGPPEARLEADAVAVDNESVRLDASASDASGEIASYEWDLTGDGSFDRETSEPVLDHRFDAGERTVTVRVTDEYGLSGTATASLTVTDVPAIETDSRRVVRANESASLEAAVTNEVGAYAVSWRLPDGTVIEGERVDAAFEPGSHELEVIVEDEYGARASATVEVVSTDEPRLTVDVPDPERVERGESVRLAAAVTNEVGDVAIRWTLPDGSTLEGAAVDAAFDLPAGEHRVEVVAEDEFGASVAETVTVTVVDRSDSDGDESALDSSAVYETATASRSDGAPGFGGIATVVALALSLIAIARRR